jgi:UDP-glucose 4-epimerase
LVDALATNNQITVVDNLTSGKLENLRPHLESGIVRFVHADITDLEEMKGLVLKNQVVFHLAVQGLRVSLFDPYLVHEVNATGTLNVCQAALEAGVERLVYISSSEVYGTAKMVPMSEDHPLVPTTPYGASKLAGEAYARSYYLAFGLPVVIVRPFNTYGPREHLNGVYGEVIPRFVVRVMNNLPPIIFGDGQQTRDLTEVSDIVRGIMAVSGNDNVLGETINIAAGREVSINELAQLVLRLLGRDGQLPPLHMEGRPGDVRRHYADITKARQLIGFQPNIPIEEGLERYIAWVGRQNWDLKQLQQEEVIINWRPI